jgi:hypothetical protein
MLPPRLKEVKERLEAKSFAARKAAEDELLAELTALDRSTEFRELIETTRMIKMTSGPSSVCPCCGK